MKCPVFAFLLLAFFSPAIGVQAKPSCISSNAVTPLPPDDPELAFRHPPESAKPLVYWFWMGRNITREGITGDLEALKEAGFGGATMCNLGDQCTPWPYEFENSINPGMDPYISPSWWALVRHAASEAKRLGLLFGMHNCPGYETSGGPWITPELSMLETCSSTTTVEGEGKRTVVLKQPSVDPHSNSPWPVFNADTRKTEKPVIEARKTFYRDVKVLAVPAEGVISPSSVHDLTKLLKPDGSITWDVPAGKWVVIRTGYTTMGKLVNPTIWKSAGLEADKMNPEAVALHMDHVLGDIKTHLGGLVGSGLKYLWIDSYEYGNPLSAWTPRMLEEFRARRGYDATPFLSVLAGRIVESPEKTAQFKKDFHRTVSDLYRDVHFRITSEKCHAAGLELRCEPYTGPWVISEVTPYLDGVSAEFWNRKGIYKPVEVDSVVAAARGAGQPVITAEAFTAEPAYSRWDETPAKLKSVGDRAFCDGINRLMLHRFTHQPWDNRYRPGMVMGQWGTHFDRTQTWWKPGKAWIDYLSRCQALLQWGKPVASAVAEPDFSDETLHATHRTDGKSHVFFVANSTTNPVSADCSFAVGGLRPELWNPVDGTMRDLPVFRPTASRTQVPLVFAPAESAFIVFRKPVERQPDGKLKPAPVGAVNYAALEPLAEISGPWKVSFDPSLGGPKQPVVFEKLTDWTDNSDTGIRYYSGTARYETSFDAPEISSGKGLRLDLGTVQHLARVILNDHDLGVVWTAPWQVSVPSGVLREKGNVLRIEVTNVWANRLIGDEQEPEDCDWTPSPMWGGRVLTRIPEWVLKQKERPSKGRYCFTPWNYFTKNSPLVPSGLLGPVQLIGER